MNAGSFRALSRAMFRGYVRDRSALVFSMLIPVLFLVMLGSIYKTSGPARLKVVEVGKVSLLDGSSQVSKVLTISKSSDLRAALDDVRTGAEDAAVQQRGNRLLVRYSAASPTTAGLVMSIFSGLVQQADLSAAGRPPAFQLAAQQVEDRSLKPIQYLAPGLLGWAIAAGGAFAAAITLVGWRQTKLLRRLRLAPVSTTSVVAARIGVSLAVGVAQMFVFMLIATSPYFGLKLTAYWWMAIPVVMAGTLAFMSIGLLVGAVATTQQSATNIANLIILPMAFLGGAFVPLDFAPQWVRDASYVMPLRYLVSGMQNVMARGEGPGSALPAIGILVAFAVALTLIAARVFRWDEI